MLARLATSPISWELYDAHKGCNRCSLTMTGARAVDLKPRERRNQALYRGEGR